MNEQSTIYPNMEQGANRLVVTSFEFHVTPVMKLINIYSSPKNSVTPGWNSAFPTVNKRMSHRVYRTRMQ